ncbi:MAG: hypothetical protein P4L81_00435 [Candidatus Pacebacteria bacterium]|nr:hypothetical protein [Candidatus Paceibacterota bacterium]
MCTVACWSSGVLAGAEVLREMKQMLREKREEKEAAVSRRDASVQSRGLTPARPVPVPAAASGELETKAALERILGVKFIKLRPPWLRNTVHQTGRNLEIDCFNEALGIAVEHNGQQHYKFGVFHKTLEEFTAQVQRDALKRQVCEARGLVFIVVPYTIPRKGIEAFLLRELTQRGVLPRRGYSPNHSG